MPTINQETQTALFPAGLAGSKAEIGARDPVGLLGGPSRGGKAGHRGTPSLSAPTVQSIAALRTQ